MISGWWFNLWGLLDCWGRGGMWYIFNEACLGIPWM